MWRLPLCLLGAWAIVVASEIGRLAIHTITLMVRS